MSTEELLKTFIEHDEVHRSHESFYELAEKYGFCTSWCHLENDCNLCEQQ